MINVLVYIALMGFIGVLYVIGVLYIDEEKLDAMEGTCVGRAPQVIVWNAQAEVHTFTGGMCWWKSSTETK